MSLSEDFKRPPAFDKGHKRGAVNKDKVDRRPDGKIYVVDEKGGEQLTPQAGIRATLDQVLANGNNSNRDISVRAIQAVMSVRVKSEQNPNEFIEIDAGLGAIRMRQVTLLPPPGPNKACIMYLASGMNQGLYYSNGDNWIGPIA